MGNPLNLIKRFGRTQSIRRNIAGFAFDLLFNPSDADLEELVQVRAEDAKKLHPLDQRLGRVLRLLQNPTIELEPAQFAVDEIFRIAEPLVRRLARGYRYNNATSFRFDPGSRLLYLFNIDNQSRMTRRDLSARRCDGLVTNVFRSTRANRVLGNVRHVIFDPLDPEHHFSRTR